MSGLTDVIAALEKATGPSRELDGRIWCAVNDLRFEMWDGAGCVWRDPGIRHQPADRVRTFTASADEALSLLPPPGHPLWTMTLRVVSHGSHGLMWGCEVTVPSREFHGHSRSPAIALCIAALRARAQ